MAAASVDSEVPVNGRSARQVESGTYSRSIVLQLYRNRIACAGVLKTFRVIHVDDACRIIDFNDETHEEVMTKYALDNAPYVSI